jgi:RNA polymerase sigma-70 factor (ECF subfamily)
MNDLDAIRLVLDGDAESFAVLVRRYQGPLCVLVRNLLPRGADWEDIAQDVFLAAFANLRSFDAARASFRTWLFTIARNRCFNALKRRRPILPGELPEGADAHTPDAEAERREWFGRLDTALDELPFEQKTAFVLAEIQDLSCEEIGRIEGVSVGTVKSRLARARQKLRAALAPAPEPP